MADKTPAKKKPYYDAKGREVFSVDRKILAGGAPYRRIDNDATDKPSSKPGPSGPGS